MYRISSPFLVLYVSLLLCCRSSSCSLTIFAAVAPPLMQNSPSIRKLTIPWCQGSASIAVEWVERLSRLKLTQRSVLANCLPSLSSTDMALPGATAVEGRLSTHGPWGWRLTGCHSVSYSGPRLCATEASRLVNTLWQSIYGLLLGVETEKYGGVGVEAAVRFRGLFSR